MSVLKEMNKTALFVVSLLILLLPACRDSVPEVDLFAAVPADAPVVVRADMRKLLAEAGCTSKNLRFELTGPIRNLAGDSDPSTLTLLSLLADIAPEADITSTLWYVPHYQEMPVVTLKAIDQDALVDRLAATASAMVNISGYNVFTFPGANALVRDGQLWISRSADHVIDCNDKAAHASLSVDKAKIAALDGIDADIYAIVDAPWASLAGITSASGTGNFLSATAKCGRSGFKMHMALNNADGSHVSLAGNGVGALDASFLGYVPRNTALCAALGTVDWHVVYLVVAELYSGKYGDSTASKMVFSMLKPYIESINGTVAVAIAPAAGRQSLGDFNISSWEFMMWASMPPEKLDQLTSLVSTLGAFSGIPVKVKADGTFAVSLDNDVTLTIGNIDNHLVIANYDLDIAGKEDLARGFYGKIAAVGIDIPVGSDLARVLSLPWGLSVDAGASEASVDADIKLNGINTTPLKALIEGLAE